MGEEVGRYLNIILRSIRTLTKMKKTEKLSKQSSSPDRTTKISDVLLWIFLIEIKIIKTRFGDTKSRIRPNQTLSIKLKTLHVIIVKKFLVEAAFRIKIMYQLFMKAL